MGKDIPSVGGEGKKKAGIYFWGIDPPPPLPLYFYPPTPYIIFLWGGFSYGHPFTGCSPSRLNSPTRGSLSA